MSRTKKTTFGPRETQRIIARRKKWVDALRSGEYPQGLRRLRSTDPAEPTKYCCLGVADEVCKLKNSDNGSLNPAQRLKLGINRDHQGELISGNDSLGKTFQELADMIEKLPIVKEV